MIAQNIPAELAALKKMKAKALREKYRELFGEESRSGNRQWLFRRCAWRIQSLAEGELSERALHRARQLARDVDIRMMPPAELDDVASDCTPALNMTAFPRIQRNLDARLPMPGTKLTRVFKGHKYQVEVLDNGFEYDGEKYRSLSAVAHTITGSHWNGYLFFGLNDPNKESA
jgi:hypothetical protein